jgi:hypothetical protein
MPEPGDRLLRSRAIVVANEIRHRSARAAPPRTTLSRQGKNIPLRLHSFIEAEAAT